MSGVEGQSAEKGEVRSHQISIIQGPPVGYVDATAVLADLRHLECRICGGLVLEISTETHTAWHTGGPAAAQAVRRG